MVVWPLASALNDALRSHGAIEMTTSPLWPTALLPALRLVWLHPMFPGQSAFGERRAVRAALLLALMPGLVGIGRLLTLDGLLTFFVCLGQLSGFAYLRDRERWAGWLWAVACGLGVLTKGPIAIVLVVAPLFI